MRLRPPPTPTRHPEESASRGSLARVVSRGTAMTSASIARGEKETQSKEQWSGAVGVRREPAMLREGNRLGRVPGRYRACERRHPTVQACLGLHPTVWTARPPACTLPLPPHPRPRRTCEASRSASTSPNYILYTCRRWS